jgi:hypothetical protein
MRGERGASWEAGGPVVCGGGTTSGMYGEKARLSKDWGPRARAERTQNMASMVVTLEVSKLSGWLKAHACCRVEGEGMRCGGGEVRAGRREGLWCGGGTTSGMHGARLKAWGPRARAERTANMASMVVTLEVSKLSGWLEADAPCRVEGRACDAGGRGASREAGGPVVWWRHDKRHAPGEQARLKAWGPRARAERTRNM